MAENVTATETDQASTKTEWYGLGKLGWGIYAAMMVMNLVVIVSETVQGAMPPLEGLGLAIFIIVFGYLWVRFLKLVLQFIGVISNSG